MTEAEIKSSILAQLNQQALTTVVDRLAALVLESEKLKAQVAEQEAKLAGYAKPASPATD